MGGERSSTTRMRLAGKICCFCGRYLDSTLWQPPDERSCDSCAAQRAPAPKLCRIHMSFVLRERWHCPFMWALGPFTSISKLTVEEDGQQLEYQLQCRGRYSWANLPAPRSRGNQAMSSRSIDLRVRCARTGRPYPPLSVASDWRICIVGRCAVRPPSSTSDCPV